jgi:SAM-dependent methyltransferase
MKQDISRDFNPRLTKPHYLVRNRLLKYVTRLAPELKGRLMDFGCGTKPYYPLFNVDEYVGVDYENPGHPHANEKIDIFYNGKSLPFPDQHFDSVFSSEVFEHVFNLDEILPEINRVMKGGAKILITCPFSICEHEVPNDFARYSSFALKHLFIKHGFEVVQQYKTGNSIEAIYQLSLTYIHQHITPHVRKVPVVRSAFRFLVYTSMNLTALLLGKIFPAGMDLYLNNVVLCKKL